MKKAISNGRKADEGWNARLDRNVISRCFVMEDPLGLHARPAALFAKTAQQFDAEVMVRNERGASVNGKSIMGLLTLTIQFGERLEVAIQGTDAIEALDAIERLFAGVLGHCRADTVSFSDAELVVLSGMNSRSEACVYSHAGI